MQLEPLEKVDVERLPESIRVINRVILANTAAAAAVVRVAHADDMWTKQHSRFLVRAQERADFDRFPSCLPRSGNIAEVNSI